MMRTTISKNKTTWIALLMTMVIVCTMYTPVNAATYGSAASGSYNPVQEKVVGTTHHLIYRAYNNGTYTNNYIYTGSKLSSPYYHTSGSGGFSMTIQTSQTAQKTQTYSWTTNSSLTSTYGLDLEVFKTSISMTAACGCGSSTTAGYSFTTSSSITKSVPSSAKTGYYSMAPGYTYYNVKDYTYNTSTGATNTMYYRMPYGDAVVYSIYSSNNSGYSKY